MQGPRKVQTVTTVGHDDDIRMVVPVSLITDCSLTELGKL